MKKDLDELLVSKYPEIFKDRNGDMKKTAMCWGFECGDGWFNIIDSLCEFITNQTKYNKGGSVIATQVKEKYGTLRFYYTGGDDFIDGAVGMAEHISSKTCEICGNPGTINNGGWIKVRCKEHE